MSKKRFVSLLLSLALMVSLAACGGDDAGSKTDGESSQPAVSQPAGEPRYGGTLRVGLQSGTATSGYTPEMTANSHLLYLNTAYESLTFYDESGAIVPRLATKWETDADEPSITWFLREDVNFADGLPFNAEAVKRTIEEYQKCGRNETKTITECVIVDEYTIKMVLSEWNSGMVEMIGFFVYYMSPDALKDVDALRVSSCGTGAFQVDQFESGSFVKYVKNENYWQEGLPYLDGVNISTVMEPSTLASALKAGEFDIASVGDMTLAQDFINNKDYIKLENKNGQGVTGTGLICNSSNPDSPFADARVRQAMCYAIDAQLLVDTFCYGMMQVTNQWAVPGSVTYSEEVKGYPYNPEKAKELLAEAGYPNGFDTVINCSAALKNLCTAAGNMLTEVGIRCTMNIVDQNTGNKMMTSGQWDGIMTHANAISPDLGLYMGRHLDYDGAFYAAGIQHPDEAMELLEAIRTARTEEEKIELEHQMQVLIYDELALFGKPIFVSNEPVFKHTYVHDDYWRIFHKDSANFMYCWLEQ